MAQRSKLVWMDLEMTGLNPEYDRIIEIATIVTDDDLNVVAEGPVFAIHQGEVLLESMDSWNKKFHGQSGLIERVQQSTITEQEAQQKTIEFLEKHVKQGASPLCGNSVWQDRRFLARYMPKLEAFFHYRLLDVSTLKELAKRWQPEVYKGFKKENKHQALADILESIEELRYYRQKFIRQPT